MAKVLQLVLYPGERRPDPPPLAVDLTSFFLLGIGAWVVALIVTLIRWRAGDIPATSAWTCIAGIVLGLAALTWVRLNRPVARRAEPTS